MADKNFKVKSGLNIPITSAAILTTDSSGNVSSSATLPISAGGTGQTTATNAINALLPVQDGNTINYSLQSNGTNVQWSKLYNQTIKNNGTTVNPRGIINFIGASFADDSGTDTTTLTLNPAIKTIEEKTANYTIATSDNNKIIEVNSSSNINITIPTNTADSIPVGSTISIVNKGTGGITFLGQQGSLPLERNNLPTSYVTITYGDSKYVTGNSSNVSTSTDGINWISRGSLGLSTIRRIKFLQGAFYATCSNGISRSLDGINWTTVYTLSSSEIRDIDYGNGKFIAVGSDARMFISTDGITWTLISSVAGFTTQDFYAIVYTTGNNWYASTNTSGLAKSIDNGENWTAIVQSTWSSSRYPTYMYYTGTYIIQVPLNNQAPKYFSEGSESTTTTVSGTALSTSSGNLNFSLLYYSGIYYLLLSGLFSESSLISYLYTSTDGINYTLSTSLTNTSTSGLLVTNGAVSDSGLIIFMSSTNSKVFTTGSEVATIYSMDSSKIISSRYGKAELYKYSSNNWILSGDLDSNTVDVELNNDSYYNLMGVI